jgi:hypothetical protein
MGFRSSILAGTQLIREAIQSSNYLPGASGWTINRDGSAEFADLTIRSSDGSGATVEVENGKAIFTAANGWQIIIDPTNDLPIIYFKDGQGDEAGAINATGDNTRSGLNVSSGPFIDGPVTDYRWVTFMGESSSNNSWNTLRTRDSDPDSFNGGWIFLDRDTAQLGVVSSTTPTVNTLLQIEQGVALLDEARLYVSARPSTQPAFRVDVATPGHTGWLVHIQREGSVKYTMDKDGNVTTLGTFQSGGDIQSNGHIDAFGNVSCSDVNASGMTTTAELDVVDTTFITWTPTITGGGSATFAARDGWYYKVGQIVYFNAYFAIGTAGTGTANVLVTLPSTPYRGAANRRQTIPGTVRDGGVVVPGPLAAMVFAGGSGATIDRILNSAGADVVGSMLTASSIWTIQGSYREL